MALNIADLVEHAVDVVPERTALVCGDRSVTYAELEQRTNRLAHYLSARGVGPGSHVGVHTRNRIEAVETMVAAYKLRAVAINVNYRYVRNELRYVFDNADLVALVHERQYTEAVADVLPDVPGLQNVLYLEDGSDADVSGYGGVEYESALAEASSDRDFGERSSDDLYVLYTGGTTGHPKGVMWRHEDVWRVLGGGIDFTTGERITDEWHQSRQGEENGGLVTMPIPPLIHGAAQWATLGGLFSGSTIVLVPQFDGHEVWRMIQRHAVNIVAMTGDAMARPLIEAFREGDYDASSLLALSSSAALFSPSLKEQYLDVLPNVIITDSIGSSETGFGGIGIVQRGSKYSGGPRVQPGKDSIVVDDSGRQVEPGSDVVGYLAKGGHIPLGYYKDPDKTAAMFTEVDGKRYVTPGDQAMVEEDGSITLLGRGNMCVNTGGEKVFPEEVEGALKSHPDVFDAVVIGVPDERLGERVAAIVQARDGRAPDFAGLTDHVRGEIAGYKVPRSLWLTEQVMRNPGGKPDYRWAQTYASENEAHAHLGAARSQTTPN